MLLFHIVFAYFLAALLFKAIRLFFATKHTKVIIITAHNNAIIGYLQAYAANMLPKTVLPNGAVVKIVVRSGYATFSFLTEDGDHAKFLKKEHITEAFSSPVPFNAPNSIVYIVRHGESEANVGIRYTNPSLTPAGLQDAVRAGEAIASDLERNPEFILVSSPLTRAIQTMIEIKRVLGTTTSTVLDVRCIESVRDMGRPIHTRGPNTDAMTITACNPYLDLTAYRDPHICNPIIDESDLENLVAPNKLPPKVDFIGVNTELLENQLVSVSDWSREAATTPLHELVAYHM